MRDTIIGLLGILSFAFLFLGASDCNGNDKLQEQRVESIKTRAESFERAERLHPVPEISNFPMRQALVEYTKRQDLINHPWYVYVLGENGNVLGYYVAKTYPQSVCNFLSSTEEIKTGPIVLTAPSLDGIYYGGGGASSACEGVFFFDAATNAMVVLSGLPTFATDQPLLIDAEAITIKQE